MERAQWIDGNATAGFQSALAKNNLQIPEASAESRQLGDMVLDGWRAARCSFRRHCR